MSRGATLAVSSYVLWGLSPIYWRIEGDVPLIDVILWRAGAAAVLLLGIQIVRGTFSRLRLLVAKPKDLLMFGLNAFLLSSNWLAFIWVVTSNRVLEASLGYFINPLMSVLLGVLVLRERLRVVPMLAVLLAAFGVAILTYDVGTVPWPALYLAGSFATYGLFRKTSRAGSVDGLTIETMLLFPFVLALLLYRMVSGEGIVEFQDFGLNFWLIGAGVVTIAPLLLFAASTRLIELWVVGMLQFVAPILQFVLAVWLWNEPFSGGVALGFVLIWVALAIFAVESFWQIRRARLLAQNDQVRRAK